LASSRKLTANKTSEYRKAAIRINVQSLFDILALTNIRYDSTKEVYEQVSGYLDESRKQVSELSAWKLAHSGNYRNAGRPRKFDKFEQGHSIYLMHDKEYVSFRKIADLMNMSYSSARRLYQEYCDFINKYGTDEDIPENKP